MKHASVAEIKARLSEYLAAARRGDDVIVTDRGRPVARLTGLSGTPLEGRVAELVRTGVMRPPRSQRGQLPPATHADPAGRLLEILLTERDEGV